MTLVNCFVVPLAILVSLLPSVLAHGHNCPPNHFWYDKKHTCLPTTAPNGHSTPPHGQSCPSGWYWDHNKSSCLPTSPQSGNSSPACQNGHSWNENAHSCLEHNTYHNSGNSHSGDSNNHGYENYGHSYNHGYDNSGDSYDHGHSNSGDYYNHGYDNSGDSYDHGHGNSGDYYNHGNDNPGHSYDYGNDYPGCEDDSRFWYYHVNSCIPHGGYDNPPPPPTGSRCPEYGWYWAYDFGCCLPSYPSYPSPQCPSGWSWNNDAHSCEPVVAPPQPSHRYGNNHRKKRSQQNLYPFY